MIKVGVIGAGGMGGRHIRNLASQTPAQVVAIMDIDRARAEAMAAQSGGGRVYIDAEALIADPEVEAVVIASPDPFHAQAALGCLAAGKPALCEKPLATNLVDAEKVLKAEMGGGKRLIQLGFMREYDPAHRAVKEIAERGELGQLLMFRGTHSGFGSDQPPSTEEVIINSAIHDIHSARWLLNQEIAEVYVGRVAAVETLPESCRLLLVQLTFKDGSLGQIEVNVDSGYGYQVEVELTGTAGSVRTSPAPAPVVRRASKQFQTIDKDWLVRFEMAYISEIQAWVRSVIEGKPTGVGRAAGVAGVPTVGVAPTERTGKTGASAPSVWDGYAALVVAEACIQSAKTGQPQAVPTLERPAIYSR